MITTEKSKSFFTSGFVPYKDRKNSHMVGLWPLMAG
jgi:hypothetical protein